MNYRIVSVSFDIDPVDLTDKEVNIAHSSICDDVLSKDWEADDAEDLFNKIIETYKYPLASIMFFPINTPT